MTRDEIVTQIKRAAAAIGGNPLGRAKFQAITGIGQPQWGRYWARWSDAITEAGLPPNPRQQAYDSEFLLARLAKYVAELGRFPVATELRMKRRDDPSFPSHNTFARFGGKTQLAQQVIRYCQTAPDLDQVVRICQPIAAVPAPIGAQADITPTPVGSVYLIRSGRYYKIGRSNAPARREYELALQLPEQPKTIHVIETDDPAGIEHYWHNRFQHKRKGGEWFALSAADVAAFMKRKFM